MPRNGPRAQRGALPPRRRARFVLSLAWREARGSRRRGLLIVAAVAIGTAALVAINSFTDNLRESVGREARALLGADLALSSASPFSPAAEALLAEVRTATAPPAEVARVVSFGAMALRPGGETTRLVRVQAVDPGYPYYGAVETAPAGEWARLAETGGAVADASLLAALGARTGDEIVLGEARFVLRATLENMPGDVGFTSALGPRVLIPRARVVETSLLTRGSRARYEAFLRLPPGADAQKIADRFRSRLSAERLNVRTVSDDQRGLNQTLSRFGNFLGLVALVALLLGGLGVASAVHVLVRPAWPRWPSCVASALRAAPSSPRTFSRQRSWGWSAQRSGRCSGWSSSSRFPPCSGPSCRSTWPGPFPGARSSAARHRRLGGAHLLAPAAPRRGAACRRSRCCGATADAAPRRNDARHRAALVLAASLVALPSSGRGGV